MPPLKFSNLSRAGCTHDHASQETPGWSPFWMQTGRVRAKEDGSPSDSAVQGSQSPQAQRGLLCSSGCWSSLAQGPRPSGILGHVRSAAPGSVPRSTDPLPDPGRHFSGTSSFWCCWGTGSIWVVSSVKSMEEGVLGTKVCRLSAAPRTLRNCYVFITAGMTFGFSKWSIHTRGCRLPGSVTPCL